MPTQYEAKELFANRRVTLAKFAQGHGRKLPPIIRNGVSGLYAYELCRLNILGKPAFGVSVVSRKTGENLYDKDRCFDKEKEADFYIDDLRKPKVIK